MAHAKGNKIDEFMIFGGMAHRASGPFGGAKLLNQLAHLQLLQRCAAPCRRGRALVWAIADPPRKSGGATPLNLSTAAAMLQCALPNPASTKQGFVSSLSAYANAPSPTSSAAARHITTGPTTSNPQPKAPARPKFVFVSSPPNEGT